MIESCAYCGVELPASEMLRHKGDEICPDCLKTITEAEEEVEAEICSSCNGSGEGQYEGTRCWDCHGKGVRS